MRALQRTVKVAGISADGGSGGAQDAPAARDLAVSPGRGRRLRHGSNASELNTVLFLVEHCVITGT